MMDGGDAYSSTWSSIHQDQTLSCPWRPLRHVSLLCFSSSVLTDKLQRLSLSERKMMLGCYYHHGCLNTEKRSKRDDFFGSQLLGFNPRWVCWCEMWTSIKKGKFRVLWHVLVKGKAFYLRSTCTLFTRRLLCHMWRHFFFILGFCVGLWYDIRFFFCQHRTSQIQPRQKNPIYPLFPINSLLIPMKSFHHNSL